MEESGVSRGNHPITGVEGEVPLSLPVALTSEGVPALSRESLEYGNMTFLFPQSFRNLFTKSSSSWVERAHHKT